MSSPDARLHQTVTQLSLVRARLLSTLDQLDALQQAHTASLAAAAREQRSLEAKLRAAEEEARAAEADRMDMRDAVGMLVMRGMSSAFVDVSFLLAPYANAACSFTLIRRTLAPPTDASTGPQLKLLPTSETGRDLVYTCPVSLVRSLPFIFLLAVCTTFSLSCSVSKLIHMSYTQQNHPY